MKPLNSIPLKSVLFLLLTIIYSPSITFANTATTVEGQAVNIPGTGAANAILGNLQLYNTTGATVTVEIPVVRSPFGYTASVTPDLIRLEPDARVLLRLQISISSDGKRQVLIPLKVKDADGNLIDETSVDVYFRVERGQFSLETFQSLFLNPIAIEQDEDGSRVQIYPVEPQRPGLVDSDEFNVPRTPVEELEAMSRDTVFKTDWSEHSKESSRITSSTNGIFDEIRPLSGSDMVAIGTLKFTDSNNVLQPCYGWRVYAYAMLPGGNKLCLAKGNVKSNGNWQLTIPYLPPHKVRIEYQPRNVYFTIKYLDESYYSFTSGALHTPAPGATLNEFTQAVYSGDSILVGLGEIYRDGMLLWDQLKTKGGGISPVRDKSISIYYPNLIYDCGNSNFQPWSCASTDGKIWIIPTHAINKRTILHELGHQLHYEYWNNYVPGNGGSHKLSECYSDKGMVMVEGFANFISMWAKFDPNTVPSGTGTISIETPPNSVCTTANRNELYIAATFWDLYDTVNDGNDTYNFSNTGSVIGIFLQWPLYYNNMAPYRTVYKLFDPVSQSNIDNIFNQNNQ